MKTCRETSRNITVWTFLHLHTCFYRWLGACEFCGSPSISNHAFSVTATELFWKEGVLIFSEICVKIISWRSLIFNKISGCKIFNFLLYLGIDQGFWNSCLWLLFLFTLKSQNLLVFYWRKSHQGIFCKDCSNYFNNWDIIFLKIDFLKRG